MREERSAAPSPNPFTVATLPRNRNRNRKAHVSVPVIANTARKRRQIGDKPRQPRTPNRRVANREEGQVLGSAAKPIVLDGGQDEQVIVVSQKRVHDTVVLSSDDDSDGEVVVISPCGPGSQFQTPRNYGAVPSRLPGSGSQSQTRRDLRIGKKSGKERAYEQVERKMEMMHSMAPRHSPVQIVQSKRARSACNGNDASPTKQPQARLLPVEVLPKSPHTPKGVEASGSPRLFPSLIEYMRSLEVSNNIESPCRGRLHRSNATFKTTRTKPEPSTSELSPPTPTHSSHQCELHHGLIKPSAIEAPSPSSEPAPKSSLEPLPNANHDTPDTETTGDGRFRAQNSSESDGEDASRISVCASPEHTLALFTQRLHNLHTLASAITTKCDALRARIPPSSPQNEVSSSALLLRRVSLLDEAIDVIAEHTCDVLTEQQHLIDVMDHQHINNYNVNADAHDDHVNVNVGDNDVSTLLQRAQTSLASMIEGFGHALIGLLQEISSEALDRTVADLLG